MRKIALVIYFAVAIAVYGLLLSRQSENPILLGYSWRYLAILFIALGIFFVPTTVRSIVGRLGWRKFAFSLIPAAALALVLYFAASTYYYNSTRVRLFDPFLQNGPATFDVSPRGANEFRVLVMGGSTTGWSRYPKKLRDSLQATYPGRAIRVFNAGVPFWTTKHSLINYVTYAHTLDPDLVIVMHAINDVVRSCSNGIFTIGDYKDDYSHFYGPASQAAQRPTFERAAFLSLFGSAFSWVTNRPVDYPTEWFRSLGAFEENLRQIARRVRSDGAQLALLTQPSMYRAGLEDQGVEWVGFGVLFCESWVGPLEREHPSGASMQGALADANERARRVADDEGALLIEVDRQVPKTEVNFYDDVHHTDAGGELIGRVVAQAIIDSGVVTAGDAR